MSHYKAKLEKITKNNKFYRKVIFTTKNLQLVLMRLKPSVEIGEEKHKTTTQFIRVESGKAKVIISGKSVYLNSGDSVIIPPNKKHNVINNGKKDLKLYTIYSPPEHPRNRKQKEK